MAEDLLAKHKQLLGRLGLDAETPKAVERSPREQRILAGYEEIERWIEEHGRVPQHGEGRDIFERLYAVRLDRLRTVPECRTVLADRDARGLLQVPEAETLHVEEAGLTGAELLKLLGVPLEPEEGDITQLKHVRSREEIKAAEEVAQRNPCADFEKFAPLFEQVQGELERGTRRTVKYQDNAEVQRGDLFILDGLKVVVAELGEPFTSDYGRPDRRLRVVYANGTESDLLLRSLQRALNKDKASRRITRPELGPLFSDEEEADDLPSGTIYVLRSRAEHPFVAEHRAVIHKIGVTGGEVKRRIAQAKTDPTYLLAEVEVVATFKLANIHRKRLEVLLQRVFASVRLDVELKDRFGAQVEPREWFLVPLPVIEEAMEKLRAGTLDQYRYEGAEARFVKVG